ncbi:MarR family transcriptional regulator [Streptacidiphilus sp. PB12-B1b]|nr:MarR family transcriptional regulator [Streptacidiphilus sp. PB12-B1b]
MQAAHDACAVTELLEALWGRGQAAAPDGPISSSQLRALLAIEAHEGINLRVLSEVLGSSAPSVSRLCDRLGALGLVERSLGASSRREVELRLSPRGHAAISDLRDYRVRELNAVLQTMEPSEMADLARGLRAFRDAAARAGGAKGSDRLDDARSA